MERHIERVHNEPKDEYVEDQQEDEPDQEEDKNTSESSETDEESDEEEKEDEEKEDASSGLWDVIKSEAWNDNLRSVYDVRRQELENTGLSETKAKHMAAQFMKPMIQDNVRSLFMERVEDMQELIRDPLYKKIKETKKRFREDEEENFSHEEAWHCAMKKRQYLVDKAIGILNNVNIDEFDVKADESDEEEETAVPTVRR